MKDNSSLCPCGSGSELTTCCEPLLQNRDQADSPEMLMRSRYTAYVLQQEQYLLETWHKRTRPRSLNFDEHPVTWLGMEILRTATEKTSDSTGSVEFTTKYLENGQLCVLQENSKFLKEEGKWYYINGDCSLKKQKIPRNQPCPCGSNMKFKRCCLTK